MATTTVNNGVNVQALLDAREVLKGAPEAAKFTWRASCKWQNGTHSESKVQSFFGLGQEQQHKTETRLGAEHPRSINFTNNLATCFIALRRWARQRVLVRDVTMFGVCAGLHTLARLEIDGGAAEGQLAGM